MQNAFGSEVLIWSSLIAEIPAFAPFGRASVQPGLVVMFSLAAPVTGLMAS